MTRGTGKPLRRLQRVPPLLCFLLLLQAFSGAGCGRMPRVIVLEDPLTAEEHIELGVAYERSGEIDLAVREYERALRKDGESFQARVNLGNVRLAKKEYGVAVEEYRKALAIRPGDPEATNNLAWAAILSGEGREEAAADLEAVLARAENRTPALLDTLGVLRVRMGEPAAANEVFDEAERRCLEAGPPGCPDGILREIRDHRAEVPRPIPPPGPSPLVK